MVDNRPVKANKFGGRGGRFSAASRLQQQRAVREAGAKGQPEVQKGGKMSLQAQRKQPWQNYGRENQRVSVVCNLSDVRGHLLIQLTPLGTTCVQLQTHLKSMCQTKDFDGQDFIEGMFLRDQTGTDKVPSCRRLLCNCCNHLL